MTLARKNTETCKLCERVVLFNLVPDARVSDLTGGDVILTEA